MAERKYVAGLDVFMANLWEQSLGYEAAGTAEDAPNFYWTPSLRLATPRYSLLQLGNYRDEGARVVGVVGIHLHTEDSVGLNFFFFFFFFFKKFYRWWIEVNWGFGGKNLDVSEGNQRVCRSSTATTYDSVRCGRKSLRRGFLDY